MARLKSKKWGLSNEDICNTVRSHDEIYVTDWRGNAVKAFDFSPIEKPSFSLDYQVLFSSQADEDTL